MKINKKVSADISQLPLLSEQLRNFWLETNLPPELLFSFELSLEELFVNIVMHGRVPHPATYVALDLFCETKSVTMVISDDGPRFDLNSFPVVDTSLAIEKRQQGGLGLHLIKTLMSKVDYRRCNEINVVTLYRQL